MRTDEEMTPVLDGVRVLIVEDLSAIAMALCDTVEEAGGTVVGPAARLEHASHLIEECEVDAALMDVDLDGERSFPTAMELLQRGTPVILLTGYAREIVPPELAGAVVMEKPVLAPELVRKLADLTARDGRVGPRAALPQ